MIDSAQKKGKSMKKKTNALALLPFIVFIVIYLGAGIYLQNQNVELAFYQFPSVTAMFFAVLVAFLLTKGSIPHRFKIFAKGCANEDIMTMLMIYLLAGAFSSVATEMGGLESTINLGLSFIPANFLAAGLFLISGFMGTATGSSMGTISAIVPIAVGISQKSGINVELMLGACIGGAMFGDNLSIISDTTIAATKSQSVEMRDKFKINILIALPAAILTFILLLVFGKPETIPSLETLNYDLIKVLPYLLVLVLAIGGVNVFLVLTIGIFSAGIIGMSVGTIDIFTFAQSIYTGFTNMNEVFFLTLFCTGMASLITHNGGMAWLIEKLKKFMKGKKSAQLGIVSLISIADLATANNTVAIVLSGNVAKDISKEFKIDPRKTASLLDIFSCIVQGIIPYGAQLLVATSLSNACGIMITPISVIPSIIYCWVLAIFALLSIFIPYAELAIKKDPWNYDLNCPISKMKK